MPTFSIMVNRTRTIEQSVEIEVSAKDEEAAQIKAEAQVSKAQESGKLEAAFDWEETSDQDDFEYEVSEG